MTPNEQQLLQSFLNDTVDQQHKEWQEQVVHPDASNGQNHDLKIAFYSGAAAVFRIMLKVNNFDEGKLPDDLVANKLNSLVDEVSQFLGFSACNPSGAQH